MKTRKIFLSILVSFIFLIPPTAKSDMFGGDIAVLVQILANALKQFYELQKLVQNGRDSLDLLNDINRGINDSLGIVDSLGPYIDPGLYKELRKFAEIAKHLEAIYGVIVPSKDADAFKETDQVVAEAISMNNSLYDYAKDLDRLGEQIKSYSHNVSPGGAQKLTAQTLAVLIQVQNQQLRATGTALKLSAQSVAMQNKEKKQDTAEYLKQADILKNSMKADDIHFEFPRF